MTVLGIDTSTDRIGVAFHDGEDFVSVMEFENEAEAVEWTRRRMAETPVDRANMNNYNEAFTDLLIEVCDIEYAITSQLPYDATRRAKYLAKHLALTQQRLTTNPINK